MEQRIDLKSGTSILVKNSYIEILRQDAKSAAKTLFAGRTMGKMVIKKSSVSGIIFNADYLLICASGLPSPSDFKILNTADIKQYPNCIVGKSEELEKLYNILLENL